MGGLEDPEKILEQAVSDMQNDLIRLRQAAAEVTAAQKRLQNKRDMAAQTADEWYRRAELALSKGDEELAREALTRRKAHAATATQLEGQLAQQTKAVSTIMGNMKMLEGKLQEAKLKKDTLKARAQSAKSARQIQDMVGQGKEWGHGESSCVCVCVFVGYLSMAGWMGDMWLPQHLHIRVPPPHSVSPPPISSRNCRWRG